MFVLLTAGQHKKKNNLKKMPSILNEIEIQAMDTEPVHYNYPFENLVFEGGGNKGLAYCGVIRVGICTSTPWGYQGRYLYFYSVGLSG